jgi:glycosyltransferase involved in cell wall biosynthesis
VPDRLRVLLVLGPSTGGIGRHVHTLAHELSVRGHDVVVCAPAVTDETFGWAATGARFVAAPVGVLSAVDAVPAIRALRRAAAGRDVVHAHGGRVGAAAAVARLHPLLVTWHNAPLGRRRLGQAALERVAARGSDLVLGASEDLTERARRAGAREARFAAVPAPPLAPPTRTRAAVRQDLGLGDRPVVLAIARLARQKRLDLLIEATRGWADDPSEPVVVVAGEGRYRAELQARAAAARSPLRLLGHRSDVADLLVAADVVALPSDWEARPLVAQEALRVGVPLVATDVGGVRGLVGDAAVLVPAGNAAVLGTALRELLADPSRRRELASRGRARSSTWPGVDHMVDELVDIYLDLRSR